MVPELRAEIQKLKEENKKLKSWVYCQCERPNSNKFGMDNLCARCGKPIENHPLTKTDKVKDGNEEK